MLLNINKHLINISKKNSLSYLSSLVAFSGKVSDDGIEYHTESSLNTELNGQDMRKAFDTNQYQVMIVANKFQTGFRST